MPFTVQQQSIIDAIAAGESIAARAVAGAGKTTTLIAGVSQVTKPGILLAFNKKNAEDLRTRITSTSIEAKTLNALGHRIWSDHLRKRLAVSADKTKDIIKKFNWSLETDEFFALIRMVSVAKARAISPGILNRPAPDIDEWLAGAQQVDIPDDMFKHLLDKAVEVLRKSVQDAWNGSIDFDDQLYMPVVFNSRFPAFSFVAVDEAQDLSPLQHEMVARLKPQQLVVVGDPNQAIYGFRGASESSYYDLIDLFSLREMPMTMSFRCPTAVGKEARKYVADFETLADAPSGAVNEVASAELVPGAVICRFNSPLVKLAFSAIRRGVPVNYLGRDFIGGLKSIHKKAPTPAALEFWLKTRLAEAKTSGAKSRAHDQFQSLMAVHGGAQSTGRTVEDILNALGAPTDSRITLSTVHKAKGLEFPTVTFLDYDEEADGGQERNINYVGVTRAQQTLNLVRSQYAR